MDNECKDNSSALTHGVLITVEARYVPEQSLPTAKRYVFAYTVRIRNERRRPVRLQSRHWIIVDGTGAIDEVRGEGVVGEQPLIQPGASFQYVSAAMLKTPRGTMYGSYQMTTWTGKSFDAVIAPFLLAMPFSMN